MFEWQLDYYSYPCPTAFLVNLKGPDWMYYLAYKGRTIEVLKCAKCRIYSLLLKSNRDSELTENRNNYKYSCENCGSSGSVIISTSLEMESFKTWEDLQNRVDELKVGFTINGMT